MWRVICLALILGGCKFPDLPEITDGTGDGGDADGAIDSFAIAAPPTAWTRIDGMTTVPITVTRSATFDGEIVVTIPQAPASIVALPLTIAAGETEGALRITALSSSGASPGDRVVLEISGSSGQILRSIDVSLLVAGLPGTLDQTFGGGGTTISSGAPARESFLQGSDVVTISASREMHRFLFDGDLDSTFGSNGTATITYTTANLDEAPIPTGMALSSGRVLVVAEADGDTGTGTRRDLFVKRYTADGRPDLGFTEKHVQFGTTATFLSAIARNAADGVFVSGQNEVPTGRTGYVLKLDADGTPDVTFGPEGRQVFDLGLTDGVSALCVQTDGSVLATIDTTPSVVLQNDLRVVRIRPTGGIDTGFGNNGTILLNPLTPGSPSIIGANGIAQINDRVVVWGVVQLNEGGALYSNAAIWVLTSAGQLDTTFSDDGVWIYDGGPMKTESIDVLVPDDHDGYIAAGGRFDADGVQVGVAAFHISASGETTSDFGVNGALLPVPFRSTGNAHSLPEERRIVVSGGSSVESGALRFWY